MARCVIRLGRNALTYLPHDSYKSPPRADFLLLAMQWGKALPRARTGAPVGGSNPDVITNEPLTLAPIQPDLNGLLPGPLNVASDNTPWYGEGDGFPKGVPPHAVFLEGVNGGAGAPTGYSALPEQRQVDDHWLDEQGNPVPLTKDLRGGPADQNVEIVGHRTWLDAVLNFITPSSPIAEGEGDVVPQDRPNAPYYGPRVAPSPPPVSTRQEWLVPYDERAAAALAARRQYDANTLGLLGAGFLLGGLGNVGRAYGLPEDDVSNLGVAGAGIGLVYASMPRVGSVSLSPVRTPLEPILSGGSLTGAQEVPGANASGDMVRSLTRQNEALSDLSRYFDVVQLPNSGQRNADGSTNPDAAVNGQLADVYSPGKGSLRTIQGNIQDKLVDQAPNIVLNLTDSPHSPSVVIEKFVELFASIWVHRVP